MPRAERRDLAPESSRLRIGELRFRELRLDGERSIADDVGDGHCRGVYAYEFSDGTWYVGISEDVRGRHIEHLHEYRHADPPLSMERMLFAEVPGEDRKRLEDLEAQAIRRFEGEGRSLRNKAKTGLPGGTGTVAVMVDGEFGVEMPWERAERPRLSGRDPRYAQGCDSAARRRKFEELESFPRYGRLLECVARYVGETVPAPDATAGRRWIATACPGGRSLRRGEGALCVVSVGPLETLGVFRRSTGGAFGFLNFKAAEGAVPPWEDPALSRFPFCRVHGYRAADGVASVDFRSLDGLERLLRSEPLLDACYRLNVELMRKGNVLQARYANAPFMDEVLAAMTVQARPRRQPPPRKPPTA